MLIGLLNPFDADGRRRRCAATGVTGFALEWLPRISRAQSMDVLSSQANIAGYKAVMLAANEYGKFMPMLMTAAGTVKAARVLILGVGVAGLAGDRDGQAAGRGDRGVRRAPVGEGPGRVARRASGSTFRTRTTRSARSPKAWAATRGRCRRRGWRGRPAIIAERCKQVDIVITTALIPGRPAPKLIKADTVAAMKPGAVLVDLAVEQGGNVEGSEPGKIVDAERRQDRRARPTCRRWSPPTRRRSTRATCSTSSRCRST